jgi:hypothetical protein
VITTGSKWFYGAGTLTLLLAAVYGYATGGTDLGPLSVGYWGAAGDLVGYGILVSAGCVLLLLGIISTAIRDADAHAIAEVAGTEAPPAVTPVTVSYWPIVAAFGVGVSVLGLVVDAPLFILGIVLIIVATIEWTVRDWSDRATGDPAANREIRNRLMFPVEIPLGGALAIVVIVVSISRVLLAVSTNASVYIAMVLAVLVMTLGTLVALRPQISKDAIAALLVVVALAIVTAGVIGAAVGTRDFHEHEPEGASAEGAP